MSFLNEKEDMFIDNVIYHIPDGAEFFTFKLASPSIFDVSMNALPNGSEVVSNTTSAGTS